MVIQPSTTVIRDVSNSLKTLLVENISDLTEGSVSFESPGEYEPPSAKSVSQFLFQARFNPHMRNNTRRPAELEGGTGSLSEFREPPIILDLVYMITPFGPDPIAEMELFEQILGVFYDNAVLGEDILDSNLIEQGNKEIRITPTEFGMEVLNNIWSIFPNKAYKVSLFYIVSPVVIMSGKVFSQSRVTGKKIDYFKLKK